MSLCLAQCGLCIFNATPRSAEGAGRASTSPNTEIICLLIGATESNEQQQCLSRQQVDIQVLVGLSDVHLNNRVELKCECDTFTLCGFCKFIFHFPPMSCMPINQPLALFVNGASSPLDGCCVISIACRCHWLGILAVLDVDETIRSRQAEKLFSLSDSWYGEHFSS
jgi:hypothetical protein